MARVIYDISLGLKASTPAWPGEEPLKLVRMQNFAEHGVNVSRFSMGAHLGTHLDAPLHFVPDGAGLDQVPLETLLGPARVVEALGCGEISAESVRRANPQKGERLLFKTDNSRLWSRGVEEFRADCTAFSPEAARELALAGVLLVGIDYLSVEAYDSPDNPVHKALLGAGVVCLEGLDLSQVEPGVYQMACLPLKLAGAEGAPSRVVLWKD